MTECAALILAGGRGERLGGSAPKQYLQVSGVALLRRAVLAFAHHPGIDLVRVVIGAADRARYNESVAGIALAEPAVGGATRQDSARAGLESLAGDPPSRVLIHDAARPFADDALISRVIAALETHPAALPVLPVTDTLKRADAANECVAGTVERAGLVRAQTPQGFRFAEILAAHRAHAGEALTDDAAVAERAGLAVAMVAGDEGNLKITTADDLTRAEARLAGGLGVPRMGTGFDVHRFGDGDHVMLCGIRVPSERGLIGHSDADAGLHALTDALLGAVAEGDIGTHFPPSDPQWKGASSDRFLAHARDLVLAHGGEIVSADVTLICERPRIGPHREAMRARIAEILAVPVDRVSIKATTTEGLGFTGRGEGVAAQAAAVVLLPRR